ncbi:unnamed protein product [Bursaphelenchus okinawaensis]|uniref:Snake toxin/toxin-like domain-containing protein n=1 Tax=Bursaphelenchus okinawaensis TaxID=465554 RepID=A0A811L5Z4_9BILA|nr:unnamed protein product [Bursaphelenchus okinawaensis]CAG9117292.1 unnamed protein product [Bursaphelenchus okinawaensis]
MTLNVNQVLANYKCYQGNERTGSLTEAYCNSDSNGCLKFVAYDGSKLTRDCALPNECTNRVKEVPLQYGTVYCCYSNWCNSSSKVYSAFSLVLLPLYYVLH